MSDRYLVVRDNTVENLVVFNGGAWTPPHGTSLVKVTEDLMSVGMGWQFVDGVWVAPSEEGSDTKQSEG